MSPTIAPNAETLPAKPTASDFRRLGALVSLARGRTRPDAPWAPEDVAEQLWDSKDLLTFSSLAFHAMAVAKDPRFKGVRVIHHAAAGRIEL